MSVWHYHGLFYDTSWVETSETGVIDWRSDTNESSGPVFSDLRSEYKET